MSNKVLTIAFAMALIATFFMYANMVKAQEAGLVLYLAFDEGANNGSIIGARWVEGN